MLVYNYSHLLWEQIICDESLDPVVLGDVVDSFWLIQEHHGPFNR
jgi:hypothetical protein